ncbi:MAG: hypothetical protein KAW12_04325 [Candidatus Aminicenantes bacterium]|nr:hypothetical protein [Candidatus Aminicenantes bacterium]
MRKILIGLCLMLCLGVLIHVDLRRVYEKGEIVLRPDPGYGVLTDWGDLFSDTSKGIAVAKDGSVFVVDPAGHRVLKFDGNGHVKKTFGQEGQKDGELFFPSSISILNGKDVIVADLAFNRKFTIFDLELNFKRVVRTEKPIYLLVPLIDGKVAYLSQERIYSRDRDETYRKVTVYIKDIKSGEEVEATSYLVPDSSFIKIKKYKISIYAYYKGDVFIERSKAGDLLVGLSTSPEIGIYSAEDGSKTGSINLAMKPKPTTQKFIKTFQKKQVEKLSKRKAWPDFKKEFKEKISVPEFFFDEHLPYYRKMIVDDEGNLLIFLEDSSFNNSKAEFRVYSPEGKYKCTSSLKIREYKLDMRSLRWFTKLIFSTNGIFAILHKGKGERKDVRLIKVKENL